MSRFPFMSFPVDRYLEERIDLTLEQHAVLRLLIDITWQRGGKLPGDLRTVRRLLESKVAQLDGRVFNRVVPKMLDAFFEKVEDGYRNEWVDAGLSRALATSERQRSNALARGSGLKDFKGLGSAMALPKKNKRIISTLYTPAPRERDEEAVDGRAAPDFRNAPPILSPTLRAKLGLPEPPPMAAELPLAVAAE